MHATNDTELHNQNQDQNIYLHLERLHRYQRWYEAAMKKGNPSLLSRILKQLDKYTELAAACWTYSIETTA
jgi:hypothetical protein